MSGGKMVGIGGTEACTAGCAISYVGLDAPSLTALPALLLPFSHFDVPLLPEPPFCLC